MISHIGSTAHLWGSLWVFLLFLTFKKFLLSLYLNFFGVVLKWQNRSFLRKNHTKELGDFIHWSLSMASIDWIMAARKAMKTAQIEGYGVGHLSAWKDSKMHIPLWEFIIRKQWRIMKRCNKGVLGSTINNHKHWRQPKVPAIGD